MMCRRVQEVKGEEYRRPQPVASADRHTDKRATHIVRHHFLPMMTQIQPQLPQPFYCPFEGAEM